MKAFTFKLFDASKVYGDQNVASKIVVVKGAASKAEARKAAEKNISGLRIVNAGVTYPDERSAVVAAGAYCSLINRTNKPGVPNTTWFAIDRDLQGELAKLVGL